MVSVRTGDGAPEYAAVTATPVSAATNIGSTDTVTGADTASTAAGSVLDRIFRWAEDRPDAPALNDGTSTTSYGDVRDLTMRLADELVRRGARPGLPVAMLLSRGPGLVLCALAAMRAGGVYLPLDKAYPLARIEQVLEDAAAPMLIHDEGSAAIAAGLPGAVSLHELLSAAAHAEPVAGRPAEPGSVDGAGAVRPEDPAYLIYTSGSTGRPKGVLVSRGALDVHVDDFLREFPLAPQDVCLQFCSPGFDPSVQDIFTALAAGCELVFSPPRTPDAEGFLDLIGRHGITVSLLPTAYWSFLARQFGEQAQQEDTARKEPGAATDARGAGPSPLRLMLVAGEAMAAETARQWAAGPLAGAELVNAYGPTETVVLATIHRVTEADLATGAPTIPIGHVLGSRDLLVLDDQDTPVGPDGVGELWIGGTCVALGYLNRPETTAERFVRRSANGGRFYRTGDRVRVLEDGVLEFLGRVDNQVKFRGYRIELSEIEAALCAVPGIGEARVLVLDGGGLNPVLRAVVVADGSQDLVARASAALRERLPEYMVPSQILVLDTFPMTAHGKIDAAALAALPAAARGPASAAPGDGEAGPAESHPLEAVLLELFPGITDFDMGFPEAGVGSLGVMLFVGRAANRGWAVDRRQAWTGVPIRDLMQAASPVRRAPGRRGPDRIRTLPTTPVQRRVLDEIGADRDHWNSSLLLELAPEVDLDALRGELHDLIEENPILTARIDGAGPGRIVTGERKAADVICERRLADEEVTAYAAEVQRSLSVGEGPTARAAILIGPHVNRLLLVAHRVVADGYSLELLADRLEARLAGNRGAAAADYLDWAQGVWSARTEAELRTAAAEFEALPWDRCPRIGPDAFPEHGESVKLKAVFADAGAAGRVTSDAAVRAVARALADWTGAPAVRFDVQHHGRFPIPGVEHPDPVIGPFTCAAPTVLDPAADSGWRLPDALAYALLTRPASGEPVIRVPRSEIQLNHRMGLGAAPGAEGGGLLRPSGLSAGPEKGPDARERYLLKIATDLGDAGATVSVLYNTRIHDHDRAQALLALLRRELAAV